jgi:hypothetical protein
MAITATVIFDNAGSVTIQLTDSNTGSEYAHFYDSAQQAAHDVRTALKDQDFSGWDGNEDDAADLIPTSEQIRNGGYRIAKFDSLDDLEDFVDTDVADWGGNSREFATHCTSAVVVSLERANAKHSEQIKQLCERESAANPNLNGLEFRVVRGDFTEISGLDELTGAALHSQIVGKLHELNGH